MRRLVWLDMAKGLGLVGMVFTHAIFLAYPSLSTVGLGFWDESVLRVVFTAINGKFTALFGIMFGLTLFFLEAKALRVGVPVWRYVGSRLLVIAGLGVLNALFLFPLDILIVWAFAGMVALFFGRISWQMGVIFVVLGVIGVADSMPLDQMRGGSDGVLLALGAGWPESVLYNAVLFGLNWLNPSGLWALGLPLLGYGLGRLGFWRYASWPRLMDVGGVVVLASLVVGVWQFENVWVWEVLKLSTAPLTALWLLGFCRWFLPLGRVADSLAELGQSSLSFYLFHTFQLFLIYKVLGFVGQLGPAHGLLIGCFVVAWCMVLILAMHLRPFEGVVRVLTRSADAKKPVKI